MLLVLVRVLAVTLSLAAMVFCVPQALADDTYELAPAKGAIMVRYSKENASYDVYRVFDLLVEEGGPNTAGVSLAIRETVTSGRAAGGTSRLNPWWTYLLTFGPDGEDSDTPYAVFSTERDVAKRSAALFIIDEDEVLGAEGADTYHLVEVSERYRDAFAVADGTRSGGTTRADTEAALKAFIDSALEYAKDRRISGSQGHYVAEAREAYGSAASQSGIDSVYQYSGDTAYVANIPLGLYLIDADEGMMRTIDEERGSVLVYDRNERPELFVQARTKDSSSAVPTDDSAGKGKRDDLVWSEDNFMEWAYRRDVNLGEVIELKTVIIAKQGITDYRLHDVMERGLTFVDGTSEGVDRRPRVYLYSQAADATYEIPSKTKDAVNWVLHKEGDEKDGPVDGCDFEVEFLDADENDEDGLTFVTDDAPAGEAEVFDWDRIVVTYWARINEDAIVFGSDASRDEVERADDLSQVCAGADGKGEPLAVQTHTDTDGNDRNTNSAVITYGTSSHTTWARSEIATYQFDIVRADALDEHGEYPLFAGSVLSLYRNKGTEAAGGTSFTMDVNREKRTYTYDPSDPVCFVEDGTTYTYATDDALSDSEACTTHLVSDEDGSINVGGIEAGTYLIIEEEPKVGHPRLTQPIVVTIHNRAYANNDILEDDTPGSRHSNAEGDITVTTTGSSGSTVTEVYGWHAVTSGAPATYATYLAREDTEETEDASAGRGGVPQTNGGALAVGWAGDASSAGGAAGLVVVVSVVVAGAAGAILLSRWRRDVG